MYLTFRFRRMMWSSVRPFERLAAFARRHAGRSGPERALADDDESGRSSLESAFEGRPSNIESAYLAQHRFASRVAHELRTPLTILKGETQVTLNRPRTTEEYEAQLRSTLEEVAKMERTIDDLLLFARYESGETEMPFRPVHFDSVLADAAKDLRPLADARRIDLEIQTTDDAIVLGDGQALSRLVCKLLENALHYTPEGGNVYACALTHFGQTVLSVKDNGVGIPNEEIPHIFERFFRSGRSRSMHPEGTGIGLSFVSVIARLHNAEVKVESNPNFGTEFSVIFPRASS